MMFHSEETFGGWLRRQLQRRDMSQSDLARKLTTSPSTVSQWVRGVRRPEVNSCFVIADHLDLPPNEVLRMAGYPLDEDGEDREREDEKRLLVVWRKLNPDAKQDVMQYIQFLRGKVSG